MSEFNVFLLRFALQLLTTLVLFRSDYRLTAYLANEAHQLQIPTLNLPQSFPLRLVREMDYNQVIYLSVCVIWPSLRF